MLNWRRNNETLVAGILAAVLILLVGIRVTAAEGYQELSPEQVMEEIKTGKPLVLDVNLKQDYEKKHLPGAKLIQFGANRLEVMPKDKNQRIIFYCMSELCNSSHEMARAAVRENYKNIAIMPSGLNGWVKADLPTE
jgi:rhodanese-related sulfurtransferase